MSGRHMSQREGSKWLGVIPCNRPRCRYEYTWEIQAPDPPFENVFSHRLTEEQRAEVRAANDARWKEVYGHPLPADWVKLRYMLYPEGDSGNPDWFVFHTPHCAALYLDSLPAAKGNQDPRRVRTPVTGPGRRIMSSDYDSYTSRGVPVGGPGNDDTGA